MRRATPPFRADHVVSLLRPERVARAREELARLIVGMARDVWGD